VRRSQEEAYREYVTARMESLRRMAYLLCRDWHTADDLVSVTLSKLYRHWNRVSRYEHLDAYTRRILTRAWLDERRRMRRESVTDAVPERAAPESGSSDPTDVSQLLQQLPPRRRAVLVLRFYCDLSVEETAEILGCTEGTVKSQTARGLDALRALIKQVGAVEYGSMQ